MSRFSKLLVFFTLVAAALGLVSQTSAQSSGPNPTPVIIALTPTVSGTVLPPPDNDRFEPNNTAETATVIGLGTEADLSLTGNDVDYFTGYLKVGQLVQMETAVFAGLDTRLTLYWGGGIVAENDDQSATNTGSWLTFTAPTDGWYVLAVEKATVYDGRYDLRLTLVEPTAVPTPLPTVTVPPATVPPSPTATPPGSPTPLFTPDSAEPNDTAQTARTVTTGQHGQYTIGPADVDYFLFTPQPGRRATCETISSVVDTHLVLSGGGDVLAVNDNRSPTRQDSAVSWQATGAPVLLQVEARNGSYGTYDLVCNSADLSSLASPPTGASPTSSAPPATTGSGQSFLNGPSLDTTPVSLSVTAVLSNPNRVPLTVRYLGPVQSPAATTLPRTHIRLLVYYDANNDRSPGPGEGIANVSVLAVDGRGQRLARVFTNAQGEAIFNLSGDALARVVVPFVPGWSARLRVGDVNDEIVLGLPAVRLPVFLPVQNQRNNEE